MILQLEFAQGLHNLHICNNFTPAKNETGVKHVMGGDDTVISAMHRYVKYITFVDFLYQYYILLVLIFMDACVSQATRNISHNSSQHMKKNTLLNLGQPGDQFP